MATGMLAMNQIRRQTIRAEVNPMDKSTIVSIYPKEIKDNKPTITPSLYYVPPGSIKEPSLLVVGSASWWREIDEEQPLLEITNSSIQVADSVVSDYCKGLLGVSFPDVMPGIFWIPGEFNIKQIRETHGNLLKRAEERQKAYFHQLVRMADGFWARTGGNPLSILEDMKIAARELGLNTKDWMKDHVMMGMSKCIACGSPRNLDFPVCPNCKAVTDPVKAKELGIQFAS